MALSLVVNPRSANAHDPKDHNAVKKADDYQERVERMRWLGAHRFSPGLESRAVYRVRKAALEATGRTKTEIGTTLLGGPAMSFPFAASPELRAFGTVKTVTICVDFKDHRAAAEIPAITPEVMSQNLFAGGTTAAQQFVPYESLHNYYQRASQAKVDIRGDVLGWHNLPKDRQEYAPAAAPPGPNHQDQQMENNNRAIFEIVTEAMRAYDATHDFAQYDNDHDGDIDLVVLQYAGPDTGWGSFWWAYRWEFFIPEAATQRFDGKRLKQFVFSFVRERGNHDYDPSTLMHEYGHSFGLADYYDYKPEIGPPGGVGGMDMMDANLGNHCAFSRWLLDWVKPQAIGSQSPTTEMLVASAADNKPGTRAIAIFPNFVASSAPSQEFFLIENRYRVNNDRVLPGSGLLVWHVNATLNAVGNGFAYDNSETDQKLIRLMRADNPADFDDGESATEKTYFVKGTHFTPTSKPDSSDNNGTPTGVVLDSIGDPAELMACNLGIVPTVLSAAAPPPPSTSAPGGALSSFAHVERALTAAASAVGGSVDLDEIEQLDRALSSATPEEISLLWNQLTAHGALAHASTQLQLMLRTLLAHWAGKSGEAAVQAVLGMPPSPLRAPSYTLAMQSWADSHPGQAAAWYFAPAQKALRQSQELTAGDGFAEKVYRALALSGKESVASSIDELDHVSEVWGAMEGLRRAYHLQGKSADALHEALDEVKRNRGVVTTLHGIQDAVHSAAGHVGDQKKRAEIEDFIREKLRGNRTP